MQFMSYTLVLQVHEKHKGDFLETVEFNLEKLAVLLSKLPDPTHPLVQCMCMHRLTVLCLGRYGKSRLAVCPFRASWRFLSLGRTSSGSSLAPN